MWTKLEFLSSLSGKWTGSRNLSREMILLFFQTIVQVSPLADCFKKCVIEQLLN